MLVALGRKCRTCMPPEFHLGSRSSNYVVMGLSAVLVCCSLIVVTCADAPVAELRQEWSASLPQDYAIHRVIADRGRVLLWDESNVMHSVTLDGMQSDPGSIEHLKPWVQNSPLAGQYSVTLETPFGHVAEQFDEPPNLTIGLDTNLSGSSNATPRASMVAVARDTPFSIIVLSHRGVTIVSDSTTQTKAAGGHWIPGPVLPVGRCWIRSIADATSDRRILVLYDTKWRPLRTLEIDVPLVLIASDTAYVYGILRLSQPELVAYSVTWFKANNRGHACSLKPDTE